MAKYENDIDFKVSLVISKLTLADSGTYTMKATVEGTTYTKVFQVIVQGK